MSTSRRGFVKGAAAATVAASAGFVPGEAASAPVPASGGEVYIPYAQRRGPEAEVWFTRDLSAEGLRAVFARDGLRHASLPKACQKLG